ncbi:hypothetical protein BWI17_01930 [Betaproteobacteria bacterium GR16-43]|nr:hypothetical protein BWI17_01930 [Betaproteobacteria bacterium GR16-43]
MTFHQSLVAPILALALLSTAATSAQAMARDEKPVGSKATLQALMDKPNDEGLFQAFLLSLPKVTLPQGKRYIVEGDLLLTEDQVRTHVQRAVARGRVLKSGERPELIVNEVDGKADFWATPEQRRLTYAIDSRSFTPDEYARIKQDIAKAAGAWVSACSDCGISFTHLPQFDAAPDLDSVTFIVQPVNTGTFVAAAFFPSWPRNTRYVNIDRSYFTLTSVDPVGVLRHELGHVLGYRHEHTRGIAGCFYEDGKWFELTAYDPQSVMHYLCGKAGSAKLELTEYDIAGHRTQYGSAPVASAGFDPTPPPGIRMKFEGGDVNSTLFSALAILARENQLQTRTVTVGDKDDYCSILKEALEIPKRVACSDGAVGQLWAYLNPTAGKPWGLVAGQKVQVPSNVDIKGYSFAKTIDVTGKGGAEQAAAFNPLIKSQESSPGLRKTIIEGFQVDVSAVNARRVPSTIGALDALKSENFYVAPTGWTQPSKVKAYSNNWGSGYLTSCKGTAAPPVGSYAELIFAAEVPACAAKACTDRCASILMVDTPVAAHPKLLRAMRKQPPADTPPASCNGVAWKRDFHGTHMAGIMTASPMTYGMAGLSPGSPLWAYPLPATAVDDALSKHLNEWTTDTATFPPGVKIFLFASEFTTEAVSRGSNYPDAADRFTDSNTSRLIRDNQDVLLVTAAGQGDEDRPGSELIRSSSKRFPMNLGDLPNVIVVTACDNCDTASPSLLADANYGIFEDEQTTPLIHLAAPGASPIPGIVTDSASDIASANGTSQAAAFVAGTAAALFNCQNVFTTAPQIKRHLLVTSRPTLLKEDNKRVAAGIVDYELALKDPRLDWMVPAMGSKHETVNIEGWCSSKIAFTDERGTTEYRIDAKAIRRMANVKRVDGSSYWVIYEAREGGIYKRGPLKLVEGAQLLKVTGKPALGVGDFSDVLLAPRPVPIVSCKVPA